MTGSFTLYPGWAQRHADLRHWYADADHDVEITVREMHGDQYLYARVHSEEFTRITNTTAEYRLRKLARLLAHRLLERVDPVVLDELHGELNAPDDLHGCLDQNVEAVEQFVAQLTDSDVPHGRVSELSPE